jgi:hypothetical protein
MILISHRGNLNGRMEHQENNPAYIESAIKRGYDVEIDVWSKEGKLWLGHDRAQYSITQHWLDERANYLWCHAKNIEALIEMKKYDIHCFWHQLDDVATTSKGFLWAYPGKQPIKNSIAVLPEIFEDNLDVCIGICSDRIETYNKS